MRTKERIANAGESDADDVFLRLGRDGRTVERQGAAHPDFPDAVAYTAIVVDDVAELLGLDPWSGAELHFLAGTCALHRTADGGVVAARAGRNATPRSLRRSEPPHRT